MFPIGNMKDTEAASEEVEADAAEARTDDFSAAS